MKLHLPVVLLSALFAVLSASRSSAEVSFEYERSGSTGAGLSGDNIIQKGTYQDVTLTIQKGDSEDEVCVKVAPEGDDYGSVLFVGDNNQITVGSGCVLEICRGKYGVPGTFLGYLPYGRGASGRTTIDLSGELRWSDSYPDMQGNTPPDLFNAVAGTLTGIIKIHQGGTLNCARKDGKTLTLSRAAGGRGGCEMITNIEVEKGGEFRAGSVIVGEAQAFNGTETTCTATTTLTLKGGEYNGECSGSDTLGKGARNPAYATTSGKDILTTTIQIESGGKYWGGDFSRIADTSEVDNETSTVLINVDGKNSKFTTKGDIGIVSKGTSSGVTINVTNGGEFVLHSKTTGEAATVNTSEVPSQVGECSTTITVSDAVFAIEGAAVIGMDEVSDASITICGDSTFKLDYTDGGTKPEIYADVVMEGGHLQFLNNAASSDYQEAAFKRGVTVRTSTETGPVTIDLGGLDASLIKGIELNNGGDRVIGLMKDSTLILHGEDRVKISLQNAWVGQSEPSDGKQALFQFTEQSGTVDVAGDEKFVLDLDESAVGALKGGSTWEVWITDGKLKGEEEVGSFDEWAKEHFVVGTGWGLTVKSYDAESGRLILQAAEDINVWDAREHDLTGMGEVSVHASDLAGEQPEKVVIDEDTSLTADEDVTLKQLTGSRDFDIKNDESGEQRTVTLHNEDTLAAENSGNTDYSGNITADAGVTLEKTGHADLTVKGNLKAGGDVTVEDGKLAIGGDDSSIDGNLSVNKDAELQVNGKLTLNGGENTVSEGGKLSGTGEITVGSGGSLTLEENTLAGEHNPSFDVEKGGTLKFEGEGSNFSGNITGEGKVSTEGTIKLTEDGSLTGEMEGTFIADNSERTFGGNNDKADIGAQNGATVKLEAGSTFNSLDAAVSGDKGGNTYTFTGKDAAGSTTRHFSGDIVLRSGNEYDMELNLSNPALWEGSGQHDETLMLETGKNIIIENGAIIKFSSIDGDVAQTQGDLTSVVIMKGAGIFNESYEQYKQDTIREAHDAAVEGVTILLDGILDLLYENAELQIVKDGEETPAAARSIGIYSLAAAYAADGGERYDTILNLYHRKESKFAQYATSANSRAGSNMLWFDAETKGANMDQGVLAVMTALQTMDKAGNAAGVRNALAAVAGSTLTSVSAAQSAALRNQMGRVRDHALQAGRLRCAGNADEATAQQRPCKNSHVWVEGTGFFSEQHSVGDESGYRLNSWGGAVGIDAQVDAHWSVGVSLSASYGDLEARAADYAKGDLDTYTVSFWSQAKNGRWGNTLLFTLGTNEADLKRTVNYGAGSYTATSNTSGSSLGAMWELTYDFHPVKDNKSNILQPLFNVALTRTSMDGFSEKNAGNVGLTTEKQTRDTVTLGLGLRWLAAINSAKAVNRTVSTEVHANVAQDMGDRRSVANVALLADPSYTQNVYGSKAGSTAFQFGAGVNVPMTPNSQIYVNAGGELREHANAWNAALGVRMGF